MPGSVKKNDALLIFDFDQTITNELMCNFFVSKGYSDYNSGKKKAVTKEKIEEFLQKEGSGIKNEAKLKSVLQSALSSGIEVTIVSSAKYIKAVEYVVKNHLGLTKEQAQGVKVFEGTTKRQDSRIGDLLDSAKITECQDPQIGKHLCILYLLKAYKKDKSMLPQEVMLVDGNQRNTNPADDFRRNVKELLKKDMKSFLENIDQKIAEVDIKEEEINNITFKGINVSSEQTTGTDKAACGDYLDKVKEWIATPSQSRETPPPSYTSEDGSEKSLLLGSEFDTNSNATLESRKTNRSWPRVKYITVQQKSFIIPGVTVVMLGASAALLYLQDKEKFVALFANGPLYTIVPIVVGALLLAICIIYVVKQYRNTEECQTQGKNADEVLDEVLENQPKNKAIKSVELKYSNGTHSNFVLNAWEAKNDFINIDEKVISRTSKIGSVINNRPLFTALLTSVIAVNIAFPLGLLAIDGVSGVQKFYQNLLTNKIGLSLLIGSGVLALLVVCLGVHYYRKANCTNLIYSQEEIDTKNVNEKFIEEIKQERTNVLEENHSKDAKRSSLTLEQVVVQSHNYPDVVYGVG